MRMFGARNTTYAPNSEVKSADLNDLQDVSRRFVSEDFMQEAHSSSTPAVDDTIGVFRVKTLTNATVTQDAILPDGTNKVRGAIKIAATANSGVALLESGRMWIGTDGYMMHVRMSVIARARLSGVTAECLVGFNAAYVEMQGDVANWHIVASGSRIDSGIAIVDGAFVEFDFFRRGGLLWVFINGTVVSAINGISDTLSGVGAASIFFTAAGASGTGDLAYIDAFKLGPA